MAELSLMRSRRVEMMTACLVLGLWGCAQVNDQSVSVDGYQFRVPARYLVQGSIFFLPKEQNSGLRFVLNPDAELQAQTMVSIGALSESCGSIRAGTMASRQLSASCAAAKEAVEWPVLSGAAALRRVYETGSTTEWTYQEAQPGNPDRANVLATCTATSGKDGLCLSDGTYKHLVYTVHFRESDLPNLGALHTQVRTLLRAWERQS